MMAILCIVLCTIIITGCDKDESLAEPPDDMTLVGIWKVTEVSSEYQGETITYIQSQLDSMGLVWIFNIKDNGTIEQTTNLSGPLVTFPGTWKTTADQLSMTLTGPDGDPGTLVYEYAVDGNLLMLQWALPNGGTKFYAVFTKQV